VTVVVVVVVVFVSFGKNRSSRQTVT